MCVCYTSSASSSVCIYDKLDVHFVIIEYLVIRPLVKQGSRWIQPHCEPLCQLQAMLEGAEMCSTVASQIINIKCKTRYSFMYTCAQ